MNGKIRFLLISSVMTILFIISGLIFSIKTKAQDDIVQTSDILKQIKDGETIYYEDRIIEGDLDFTNLKPTYKEIYTKDDVINHITVYSPIIFYGCTFKGKVNAYNEDEEVNCKTITNFKENLRFTDCKFESEVIFKSAVFEGDLSFSDSDFSEGLTLTRSSTDGELFLHKSIYSKQVSLDKTNIKEDLILYGNTFFRLSVSNSIVYGNLTVESNKVDDFVDFYQSRIDGGSIVQNNDFMFNVDFSKVSWGMTAEFKRNNFFGKVQFVECLFNEVRLSDSVFDKGADFFKSIFKGKFYVQSEFNGDVDFDLNAYYSDFHLVNSNFSAKVSLSNIYVLHRFYMYNAFFDKDVMIDESDFVGDFNMLMSEFNSVLMIRDSLFIGSPPKREDCSIDKLELVDSYYNESKVMGSLD
jgi:uncharacterized protein YjbI with pentapeptide repeats